MSIAVWKGDLKTGSFVKRCEVPRELMDIARNFLIVFENSKQEKAVMSKKQKSGNGQPDIAERTNMVFLSGIVQTANIEAERAFFTLDVGMKQWVPCSSYKNEEIIRKLNGLYRGDFIQFKAILKPWSKKNDDGEWDRGMSVEITEVKTIVKGPGHSEAQKSFRAADDDIPF